MTPSRSYRNRSSNPTVILTALLVTVFAMLGLAGPAAAADFTADQRKEYFDSGKYGQDLGFVADYGRKYMLQRTQARIKIVRACEKKGFRIGTKDPGADPVADYTVPVTVPKRQLPDRLLHAPKPGLGPVTNVRKPRFRLRKAVKAKRITRKRCRHLPKLAIAMDMDETAASSFRYGSEQPEYETSQGAVNLVNGTQTALDPMLKLYKLARRRGMAAFIITARPELLRTVTEKNLADIGYTDLAGVYMKPDLLADSATVKNSERAEIVRRRGYRLIAMFGDQPSDLETGFFQRGFKYQSAYGPDE